jgi:hypothetical protein
MTGPDYWPPNIPRENLSPADKIDALLNDRRLLRATKPTTKHALAALTDTEQAGGRFSTQSGAQATTDYPQQDAATSPWRQRRCATTRTFPRLFRGCD